MVVKHTVLFVRLLLMSPHCCQVRIWRQTLTGRWLGTSPSTHDQTERHGRRRHPPSSSSLTCFASHCVPTVARHRIGTRSLPAAGVRRKYPNWREAVIRRTEARLCNQCPDHHSQGSSSSSSGIGRALNSQGPVMPRRGTLRGDLAVMKMFSVLVR